LLLIGLTRPQMLVAGEQRLFDLTFNKASRYEVRPLEVRCLGTALVKFLEQVPASDV